MEARPVITFTDARKNLGDVLRAFREQGATAEPVVIGAHRRPEGVLMSFELYALIADHVDTILSDPLIRARLASNAAALTSSVADLAAAAGVELTDNPEAGV